MLVILASTAFVGCKSEDVDDSMPKAKTYAFDGKVDDKFVGDWHTTPATSDLNMHKDGAVDIVAVASGPGGSVTNKFAGEWRVDGSNLMIKYGPDKGGLPIVLKYTAEITGDTMKLVQAGNHVKATYTREAKK